MISYFIQSLIHEPSISHIPNKMLTQGQPGSHAWNETKIMMIVGMITKVMTGRKSSRMKKKILFAIKDTFGPRYYHMQKALFAVFFHVLY